jgi:ribA/ribD-fused uncharacterized protein
MAEQATAAAGVGSGPSASAVPKKPKKKTKAAADPSNVNPTLLQLHWLERSKAGTPDKILCFYGHSPKWPYGELSNFWPAPFDFLLPPILDSRQTAHPVHCAEQAIMLYKAALFRDAATFTAILKAKTPAKCKGLGRRVTPFDDRVWLPKVCDIAVSVLWQKFSQNPDLKALLLDTKKQVLAEAAPYDALWGIGLSARDPRAQHMEQWQGANVLGYALMEVRRRLAC